MTDRDIWITARQLIDAHGSKAVDVANQRIDEALEAGAESDFLFWDAVFNAIDWWERQKATITPN